MQQQDTATLPAAAAAVKTPPRPYLQWAAAKSPDGRALKPRQYPATDADLETYQQAIPGLHYDPAADVWRGTCPFCSAASSDTLQVKRDHRGVWRWRCLLDCEGSRTRAGHQGDARDLGRKLGYSAAYYDACRTAAETRKPAGLGRELAVTLIAFAQAYRRPLTEPLAVDYRRLAQANTRLDQVVLHPDGSTSLKRTGKKLRRAQAILAQVGATIDRPAQGSRQAISYDLSAVFADIAPVIATAAVTAPTPLHVAAAARTKAPQPYGKPATVGANPRIADASRSAEWLREHGIERVAAGYQRPQATHAPPAGGVGAADLLALARSRYPDREEDFYRACLDGNPDPNSPDAVQAMLFYAHHAGGSRR